MKTVLVIEDDAVTRALIRWHLTRAGYRTLIEADGEAGLTAATAGSALSWAFPPDVVLLDWVMPKLSGIEICRALRADPGTADIPIVMLTGRASEADVEEGFAAGADDYLVKPFEPASLLRRVAAAMARPRPA